MLFFKIYTYKHFFNTVKIELFYAHQKFKLIYSNKILKN